MKLKLAALCTLVLASLAPALAVNASAASASAWVADASNTSSDCGNKVKSYVYCGSPYTNYSFQARGRVWAYGPTGWTYLGETWSAVVTRAC